MSVPESASNWKYTLPVIAFLVVSLQPTAATAQKERYQEEGFWVERFDREEGLPEDVVMAVLQSRKGFLWVATPYYLVRYDGYSFQTWAPKAGVYYHFAVDGLMEDSGGDIWIRDQASAGLFHFDLRTEQFTRFHKGAAGGVAISDDFVTGITEDRNGAVWAATASGLNRITRKPGTESGFLVDIFLPTRFGQVTADQIDSILSSDPVLASIDSVTDLQHRIQAFDLPDSTWIMLHAVGEFSGWPCDWGWLENEAGEKVWEMRYRYTVPAGGSGKNRMDVEVFKAPPGRYTLHYRTDDSHAFGTWNDDPPDRQSLWGVRALALEEREAHALRDSIAGAKARAGIPGEEGYAIHEDQYGDIWLLYPAGLDVISAGSTAKEKLGFTSVLDSVALNMIIGEEPDGLWFLERDFKATQSGFPENFLVKIDRTDHRMTEKIPLLGVDPSWIIGFHTPSLSGLFQPGGVAWLHTSGKGIYQVTYQDGVLQALPFPLKANGRAINSQVWSIHLDDQGHLWAAVRSYGLFKIAVRPDPIQFFSLPGQEKSPDFRAFSIFEDVDRRIWLTSSEGLWRFEPENGTFRPYEHKERNAFGSVFAFQDKDNRIWVQRGNEIQRYDEAKDQFTTIFRSADAVPRLENHDEHNNIWAIENSKPETFFQFRDGAFVPFTRDTVPDPSFSYFFVADGRLWESTRFQGMHGYQIDPEKHRLIYLGGFIQEQEGIDIWEFYRESPDTYWLGTYSHGLLRFDPNTGRYKAYTRADGLPSDFVVNIERDDRGLLWVFTDVAVCLFDPVTEQFSTSHALRRLYEENTYRNLLGRFGNARNISLGRDGDFLVLGNKGFFKFHPESIRPDLFPPVIQITHFRIGGSREENNVMNDTDFRLTYKQNDLAIHYVGIHFDQSADLTYQYKMEGLHDDWIDVGKERVARFSNLAPGDYTFRVRTTNADGIGSGEAGDLRITILPPWWRTWWAYAVYALFSLALLWFIRRNELKKQEEKLVAEQEKLAQEQHLNARLRQIDKLKDQFLANTSHELRTPLHGIIGITESLFDDVGRKSAEELRRNLGMIMASGRRLASLVNDLLDFARARNKDIQLQQKSLDLKSLVEVVLHSCRPLIGSRSVELVNEVGDDLPPVLADDNRLQQILYNLVGNAIKFTEKGSVRVGALPSEREHADAPEMLTVYVRDTGIGIPADKQEVIFRSFEQADGDTARRYGGTGLGLTITRQLVELHGGRIWLESEPGKGSAFFFTLPVSDQPARLMPEAKTVAASPAAVLSDLKLSVPVAGSSGDRIRILVVDDEPINHQVLRNHLSDDRYLITSVMNGQEAIEAVEMGVKFDLVLLDVMMPRLSGYEVCRKIRERYLPSELPVIMVTAKNQIQDLVEGFSVGANDYLAKPFSRDEFLARVRTQLDLHRINTVTGKFVPNEFLRVLGRDSITEVSLGDHIEREVTVLFSDIRDYTALSEGMTPEQNYRFVNAFNGRLGPVIRQHQGFVNQYLGDGIMAIFPENPAGALRAAVGMQKEVRRYNEERKSAGRQLIRIGIGLHSGPLIMGIIGDDDRLDAATIADSVNTASRVEDLTKFYGANILISEDSVRQFSADSGSLSRFRYLGKVRVKGRKVPIGIYECFEGDEPEIADLKWNTLPLFKVGMHHFFLGEFPEASSAFNEISKINKEDAVARQFLKRSAFYTQNGVPEGWTGVEAID